MENNTPFIEQKFGLLSLTRYSVRLRQSSIRYEGILVQLFGSVIEVILVQLEKMRALISCKLSGNMTVVKLVQLSKAPNPMLRKFLGNVIETKLLQYEKA